MSTEKIQLSDLRSLLVNYFSTWQSSELAEISASTVIDTALHKDSRMSPLDDLEKDLALFNERGRPSVSVLKTMPAVEMWDFNGAPGVCHIAALLTSAADMAKSVGIGVIGFKNTGGVHQLSQYVEELTKQGLVSFFMWNGGSYTTVPFGSTEPFFGTNPIGYGIPTSGNPLVADFSTSQIPFLDLRIALANDTQVPSGSGMDVDGVESTDPHRIYDAAGDDMVRLRPLGGGPKGSALMLLVEVLTGALVGAKMARTASDDPFIPEEFGGLFIVFNPEAFGTQDSFAAEVSEMADQIRSSKAAPGVDQIRLPGDAAFARGEALSASGEIEIATDLLALLRG